MCGLAGVAGDLTLKAKDGWLDLFELTKLRGTDAAGVFAVRSNEDAFYIKDVGTSTALIDRKSFDDTIRGLPKIIAGHCRHKTMGDNNRQNAHPYDLDNIIGMHNGTLKSYYQMEGWETGSTDSLALFKGIDKHGPEFINKLDPEGAWALVWWNKDESRLNFIRNEKRPLWFAWTKNKKCLVWASEPWMFGAFDRKEQLWDGTPDNEEDKPREPYFQIPPDQLWSFTVNDRPGKDERVLTLHPIVEIKAEGKSVGNFIVPRGAHGICRSGGEVTNPFPERKPVLGDLDDELPLQLLPPPTSDETPKPPENSQSTVFGRRELGGSLSKVLDFRRGLTRGTNLSKSGNSLAPNNSSDSPSNNNGRQYESSKFTSTPGKNHARAKTSIRDSKSFGQAYITCHKTHKEVSLKTFEDLTKGECFYCNQPIGDLSEVAEFLTPNLDKFLCTSCVSEPKIALMG